MSFHCYHYLLLSLTTIEKALKMTMLFFAFTLTQYNLQQWQNDTGYLNLFQLLNWLHKSN